MLSFTQYFSIETYGIVEWLSMIDKLSIRSRNKLNQREITRDQWRCVWLQTIMQYWQIDNKQYNCSKQLCVQNTDFPGTNLIMIKITKQKSGISAKMTGAMSKRNPTREPVQSGYVVTMCQSFETQTEAMLALWIIVFSSFPFLFCIAHWINLPSLCHLIFHNVIYTTGIYEIKQLITSKI